MVDLHIHTTCSDGLKSVNEILHMARSKGLDTIAITDHDTIDQVKEAHTLRIEHLIRKLSIKVIPGIEVSSIVDGVRVHILVYNFDYKDQNIEELCKKGIELRHIKLHKRLDYLRDMGLSLSDEHIKYLESLKTVGKPHIAECMIEEGYATSLDDACKRYLNKYKDGEYRIDVRDVVRLAHRAGAITVLAHPYELMDKEHLSKEGMLDTIYKLQDIGVDGIEVYYADYDDERQGALRKIAEDRGLLISGGSDYHGFSDSTREVGKLHASGKKIDDSRITILNRF